MEVREVVIVEMPAVIRRPPKATPCCRVCFEVETHQKLFVVEDLECECNPFLHDACVQEWFRIAGREVCPQCGQRWRVVELCLHSQGFMSRCLLVWILLVLSIFASVAMYQIIVNLYMKS
jgi:hypothetical protein